MNRTTSNICLYLTKIYPPRSAAWNRASEILLRELERNLRPLAEYYIDSKGAPTDIHYRAALTGWNQVVSCTMYFDSETYEDQLLRDTNRKFPTQVRSDPEMFEGRGTDDHVKEQWFELREVLKALIVLSHRALACIYLADLRGSLKGDLAEVYLRRRDRQSLLSKDYGRFETVMSQLTMAVGAVIDEDASDPLEVYVERMGKHCLDSHPPGEADPDDPCKTRSALARSALEFLDHNPLPSSADREELRKVLLDVVDRLSRISRTASAATAELCRETRVPGSVLDHVLESQILSVLTSLPPDKEVEQPLEQVLRGIAAMEPRPSEAVRTARAVKERIPREHLMRILIAKLEVGSPKWVVFLSLLLGRELARIRNVLRLWLPAPDQMLLPACNWLGEVVKTLRRWRTMLSSRRVALQETTADDDYRRDWLEMPSNLQPDAGGNDRSIALIDEAIEVVAVWLADANMAPKRWLEGGGVPGVAGAVEPTIRAALLIVILQALHADLTEAYTANKNQMKKQRAEKKRAKAEGIDDVSCPPLVEILLGPRWEDDATWPPPATVSGHLRRLADEE